MTALENQKPDDDKLRFLSVQANRHIPADAPDYIKWEAHFNRAYFRDLAGRFEDALTDYRTAVNLMTVPVREPGWSVPIERLALREAEAGHFKRAIAVLERAFRQFAPLPHFDLNVTMARVLAMAGYIEGAERYADEASTMLATVTNWLGGGPPAAATQTELKAIIHELKGEWYSAEPLRRSLLQKSEFVPFYGQTRAQTNIREAYSFDLARNLFEQGRLTEAEAFTRRSIDALLQDVGKHNLDTVRTLTLLGEILLAEERQQESIRLSEAILAIIDSMGVPTDSRFRGKLNHLLGKSLAADGKWQAAADAFERVRSTFQGTPYYYWGLYGEDSDVLLTLIMSGKNRQAVELLGPTIDERSGRLGEDHYDTNEAKALLAMALAARGKISDALNLYRKAVPRLTGFDRSESGLTRRSARRHLRRRLICAQYIDLLWSLYRAESDQSARERIAGEAFSVVDFAQIGTVFESVGLSAVRNLAADADTRRLLREEQDAALQIESLEGHLSAALGMADRSQSLFTVETLQASVAKLQEARARLRNEVDRRLPKYAKLVDPGGSTVADIRKALTPNEALLVFYETDNTVYAWAVSKSEKFAFTGLDLKRDDLRRLVKRLRLSVDARIQTVADIPAFDVAASYELFELVLAPVQSVWKQSHNLIVVAPGVLGQIPFSVLAMKHPRQVPFADILFSEYRDVHWLAREHSISSLPSVGALEALRQTKSPDAVSNKFVAFADPIFSERQSTSVQTSPKLESRSKADSLRRGGIPTFTIERRRGFDGRGIRGAILESLPRLPETAEEVRRMALFWNDSNAVSIYTGLQANEQVVKSLDLSGARVIAFATHSLVAGDLDGLNEPALALSSPRLANVEGDGLLTISEIYGLHLNADWIVLSACNTAAANGAGAEMLSGLGRAFFYAGARALLASYWPVETYSAMEITTRLFRHQHDDPAVSRAEALRQAMIDLVDGPGAADVGGKSLYSYAHPIFWAPFVLVGDGMRSQMVGTSVH